MNESELERDAMLTVSDGPKRHGMTAHRIILSCSLLQHPVLHVVWHFAVSQVAVFVMMNLVTAVIVENAFAENKSEDGWITQQSATKPES